MHGEQLVWVCMDREGMQVGLYAGVGGVGLTGATCSAAGLFCSCWQRERKENQVGSWELEGAWAVGMQAALLGLVPYS